MINVNGAILSALLKFVKSEDEWSALSGVLFDSAGYAVATEGNSLAAVRIAPFEGESFWVGARLLNAELSKFAPKTRNVIDYPIQRPEHQIAKFPEWRRVWPCSVSGKSAHFDSALLERVRAARTILSPPSKGRKTEATQVLCNDSGPALVWLPKSEAERYAFIVMPMRGPSDKEQRNALKLLTAFGQ